MKNQRPVGQKRLWIAFSVLLTTFILLVFSAVYECRKLAVYEAEKNLESFLLSHRSIRFFVENFQKEEVYRLKREGKLYEGYFSPLLLSSTFITRNIREAQNRELKESGLSELYFKFASGNPRNPINQADADELATLKLFNEGRETEFKAVVDTAAGKALYYAIPVARNQESCMRCHGDPADAPQEMLEMYGTSRGFHEDIGQIRALMSVRVSLAEALKEADRAAFYLSLVTFILFSGIFWLLVLYTRKMTQQEQIQERLRKAEKMESIGLMAGGVAHDLNNILSGIINYPELILMKLPKDAPYRRQLEAIQQSGYRASAVVDDLLTVARGVATQKVICDLNQLVCECLSSPEFDNLKMDNPDVEFIHEKNPASLPIQCSPIHITKSLMNLLVNAFEVSRDRCVLTTGQSSLDASSARRFNVAPGEYCFVRVEDSGDGIAEEHLPYIFEPFYSTKKMGKSGTGLGLSVVWNTVKGHDGFVTVDSDQSGSTFALYFPIGSEQARDGEGQGEENLKGRGERILVVDDEPHQRDIAVSILQNLDYQVEAVASGEAALDYLETLQVDLVLLDMMMEPGLNGRQTYEAIISRNPNQKALIVSGYSASDDVQEALNLGAGGFIKKPYSTQELGRMIKLILNPD